MGLPIDHPAASPLISATRSRPAGRALEYDPPSSAPQMVKATPSSAPALTTTDSTAKDQVAAATTAWAEAFSRPEPPPHRLEPVERLETAMRQPETWVPGHGYEIGAWSLAVNFFRGLVRLDRDANVVPDLAERITVSADGLVQPKIEPEIVVGLKSDFAPGSGLLEIAAAIEWAAAGLEVVECHFEAWSMSAAEAIADAGLHAGLAIGPRTEINTEEAMALARCECEFLRDGTLTDRGLETTALGGPVPALVWLLRGLREGLRAGEVVTTGSMIGATPVSMGQRWTNRHHGSLSSSVEVTFT